MNYKLAMVGATAPGTDSPSGSVRPRDFLTPVLVGGDLTDVESNQSRQFVLLNKQKFV